MRLLIISHLYAPDISPRAFRWTAIAERWAEQGHEVDVVCNHSHGSPVREVLNGVNIYRAGGGLIEAVRGRLICERTVSELASPMHTPLPVALIKKVHDVTWKKLYWPDSVCLWYFSGTKIVKNLITSKKYDAMISVSDPFTSHLVGLKVKSMRPDMRWIVDVGDPFCYRELTPTNNYAIYKLLNFAIERRIFSAADGVSVTTEQTARKYTDFFPESAVKMRVIPPLISLPEKSASSERFFSSDGKIRLVFIGTLYKEIRSPEYLLRLFDQLLQTELVDRLELHIIGNIHDCGPVFEQYEKLIGFKIFLHGMLKREAATQAMREADVLINIGNDTSYQLPSKVVEYASTGSVVLNLIKSDADSSIAFFEHYPMALSLKESRNGLDEEQFGRVCDFIQRLPQRMNEADLEQLLAPFQINSIITQYSSLLTELRAWI